MSAAPHDDSPIIEVCDLVAGYGETVVLEDITFTVARGERLLICGGSGCGKTTVLRHIIGLARPLAGSVRIEGEDIWAADELTRRHIQRKFGVSFQSGALFGSLTLGENVALPIAEYTTLPATMIASLVRMKLGLVSLDGFQDFMIAELSGGMKKRAALARAIALDPRIVFFDEPSAGLDPVTSVELDELIVQISRSLQMTIVAVSHELASIFTIADRVIMLDGKAKTIIATGRTAELRDTHPDPRVHAFFNRTPLEQVVGQSA